MPIEKFSPSPGIGAYTNVVSYGRIWLSSNEIGVQWDDPRDVFAMVVRFKYPPKDLNAEDIKVQYWQCSWPKFRFETMGAGFSGWGPIDDFYNGQWKDAKFNLEIAGKTWYFLFKPLSEEFSEFADYDVRYRRTLKARILSLKGLPEIESFEVYTDSLWRIMEVSIEWGYDGEGEGIWDGYVEVFNGELKSLRPLNHNSRVNILSEASWASIVKKGETDGIKAEIWYTFSEKSKSFDKTIVTIRSKTFSFSFSMEELEKEKAILIKDYNVLISKSSENLSLKEYNARLSEKRLTTIYNLVERMPEQTLERAWREMPTKKRRIHFILGCKGRRQKIGVDTRGAVFIPKLWNVRVKGKYSDRFLWDGDTILYSFSFPDSEPEERRLENDYLPIIYSKWVEDGITYEQEAFATLLFKDLLNDLKGEEMIDGDDPIACMVKITLSSQCLSPKTVDLKLSSICKAIWRDTEGVKERLAYKSGLVYALCLERKARYRRFRYILEINGRGEIKDIESALIYSIDLNPGEKHTIYVKIPTITLLEDCEIERLKVLNFEVEKGKVIEYWKNLLNKGMQIEVPEKWLSNFYKAFLSHVHITDDKEPYSHRYMCRVSSFNYGVFANESAMVISELDRRGLHDEAERRLDVFTHYQGTAVMAGKYSTARGVFYGAGGYESGDYGQHHGWVLWAFAEHYKYTRDKEWLKKVAPNLIEACDWIINERKVTMKTINRKKVIEYGFLPPGSLEDVRDFWHWIATNAHAYRGLKSAAEVLGEIRHPEAERLKREAELYKEDLLAGIMEAMVRSPVVKLRDGTWIPYIPSRVDKRGRDVGWIRETLEGAMHLILCGLIDPNSKIAEWILKDYEDNRYISDEYGYTISDFERYWFSRGGFSMQPNLYGFQIPYLWRDNIKHFLRAFFNSFAVAFYPDVYMLKEHPLPTMADWAGDHFKTSDESISCYCLRLMLIYEKNDTLILMPAVPSKWLEDGKRISVKNASTYFGIVSFDVESRILEGFIKISLSPPARNPPKSIKIHLRHPENQKMKRVDVNGREWKNYNREKNIILIGGLTEPLEITAYY